MPYAWNTNTVCHTHTHTYIFIAYTIEEYFLGHKGGKAWEKESEKGAKEGSNSQPSRPFGVYVLGRCYLS